MENEATAPQEGGVEEDVVTTETEAADATPADATADDVTDEDLDAEGEGEEGEEVVEEVELNFGGNKITLKKGDVPDDVLEKVQTFTNDTWAAATKRNQENAETRKSLEAREASLGKIEKLEGAALSEYARGLSIKSQLDQLTQQQEQIDQLWQSPNPQDRDRARMLSDRKAALSAELNDAVTKVNQNEQQLAHEREAEVTRRSEEGKTVIERLSPGFSKDLPSVIAYAVDALGVDKSAAEAEWALNPPMAVAVRKAMLYDRMTAAQKKTAPAKTAEKPVKPMKGKGGKATRDLVKDADKMSVEEWARLRNLQVQNRG